MDKEKNNYIKAISAILVAIFLTIIICWFSSCSPKIIHQIETKIEYRDREVHDTTTLEITKEVEKIVTKDTVSHLENTYGLSDAVVSNGLLYHSLETKPQIIKVPYTVTVTDTLWKQSEVITQIQEVEKKLSWWQNFRINAFGWLLVLLIAALLWIFRKPLIKLIGL